MSLRPLKQEQVLSELIMAQLKFSFSLTSLKQYRRFCVEQERYDFCLFSRLGLIYGPTHDLRTGPNGPRILRTRVFKGYLTED